MRGVSLQGRTYYVRVRVPDDVRPKLRKRELIRSLQTRTYSEACKIAPPILAEFAATIARARADADAPDRRREVQVALANWSLKMLEQPVAREPQTPLEAIESAHALERAVANPDGWRTVPDFDARAIEALSSVGVRLGHADIAPFRQEIAIHFLMAERHREKVRAAYAERAVIAAAESRLQTIEATPASQVLFPGGGSSATPTWPSITIQTLFERWLTANPPKAEKERGRLEHQFRRLREFTGDVPANRLTKVQIEEFFGLVARFPAQRRSAELSALPLLQLVERFEALNEAREENDEERAPTLTQTTAGEWFQAFKRVWTYALDMEIVERNPWERMQHTVKGRPSTVRRAFTDDEVKLILSKLEAETGAMHWLPILALYHGARLSELAAMPRIDFKGDHFDVNAKLRSLKTEAAQRLIPLHPRAASFKRFAANVEGDWLFSDLDHKTPLGPGHDFSKRFGTWLNEIGLDDPAVCFHSLRHTWKRHARMSPVKEEIHDVISGHTSINSVSRGYGAGADIKTLTKEMARITFPDFFT